MARRPDQQAWTILMILSPLPAESEEDPPAGGCVAPGVTAKIKPTRAALLTPQDPTPPQWSPAQRRRVRGFLSLLRPVAFACLSLPIPGLSTGRPVFHLDQFEAEKKKKRRGTRRERGPRAVAEG